MRISHQLSQFSSFVCTTAFGILLTSSALGATGISYEGRLLDSSSNPVTASAALFKVQVRSTALNCLLFEETHTKNLSTTSGNFALTLNDGTATSSNTLPFTIDRVFSNTGTLTGLTGCSSSTQYTPSAGDNRILAMSFSLDGGTTWDSFNPQPITYAPFAIEAKQVAGFGIDSLVRVVDGSNNPITGLTPLSNANYTELLQLVGGNSALYERAGRLGGGPAPIASTLSNGQVLSWTGSTWVGTDPIANVQAFAKTALPACGLGDFLRTSSGNLVCSTPPGGGGTVTQVNTGTGLSGGPITGAGTISIMSGGVGQTQLAADSVNSSKIQDGTILLADMDGALNSSISAANAATSAATDANTNGAIVKRDATGNFAANVPTVNGLSLKNAGSILNIVNPTGGAWTMTLPATAGSNNQVLTTNGSGLLSWSTPAGGGYQAADGSPTSPGYQFAGHANTGLFMVGNDLGISTQGLERLRVDGAGNVGIGTTAPNSNLHVLGEKSAVTGSESTFKVIMSGVGSAVASVNRSAGVFQAVNQASNTVMSQSGIESESMHVMPGTLQTATGGKFSINNNTTSGNITNANGITSTITNSSTGVINTAIGLKTAVVNASGVITNGYGLYIDTISATNRFGIYQSDSNAKNIFLGNVGIGTAVPSAKLDVKGSIVMSGSTSGFVGFQPAAAAGSQIYTLPSTDGTAGRVLSTNGAGILSWVAPSAGPTSGVCTTGNVTIGMTPTNWSCSGIQTGDVVNCSATVSQGVGVVWSARVYSPGAVELVATNNGVSSTYVCSWMRP